MQHNHKKLDILINKIRNQIPVLSEEQLLTESIMTEIIRQKQNRKPSLLVWIRNVSCAASILLICMLGFQNIELETNTPNKNTTEYKGKINIENSSCVEIASNKKINIREAYACLRQEYAKKNKHNNSFIKRYKNLHP